MNGQIFSQNPHTRAKSHHHRHQILKQPLLLPLAGVHKWSNTFQHNTHHGPFKISFLHFTFPPHLQNTKQLSQVKRYGTTLNLGLSCIYSEVQIKIHTRNMNR